jgi:hypothetical protein
MLLAGSLRPTNPDGARPIRMEVAVSLKRVLTITVTAWPALVLVTLAVRALFGSPIGANEYAAWLFLAGAPVVIALVIMRGMSSPTITQVLYDTEHPDSASTHAVRERLRAFAPDDRDPS